MDAPNSCRVSRHQRLAIMLAALVLSVTAGLPMLHAQHWSWARQSAGTSNDAGQGVTFDAAGNSYVTGHFSGTTTFGSTVLTSAGDNDIFVVKYDPSGTVLWATKAGGVGDDRGYDIHIQPNGTSVYVTGYFSRIADFGEPDITSVGGTDIFLAAYTVGGALQWVRSAGGPNNDQGLGVASDIANGPYVTGSYAGSATFGTHSLTSASGANDIFLVCYSTTGTAQWAKSAGGTGWDHGASVVVPAGGSSVVVAGTFSGTATFGSTTISASGTSDAFVAKYLSTGTLQWVRNGGHALKGTTGSGVASDGAGNLFLSGTFNMEAKFGAIPISSIGSADAFLTKYDAAGAVLWARAAGSTSWAEAGTGVAVDGSGNSFLTGYFEGNALFGFGVSAKSGGYGNPFVAKFDPLGTTQWALTGVGSYYTRSNAIASDLAGGVAIAGEVFDKVQFGSTMLGSTGGASQADAFAARLRPNDAPTSGAGCATPSCKVTTLNISTGFDAIAGATYKPIEPDGYWTLVDAPNVGLTVPSPAWVINKYGSWALPPQNSQWISAFSHAAWTLDNLAPDKPYSFERCFCICEPGILKIDMSILVDNTAEVYLISPSGPPLLLGTQTGDDETSNFQDEPLVISEEIKVAAGTYCIRIDLRNTSSHAMGLNVDGTVESVDPTNTNRPPPIFLSPSCCETNGTIIVRKMLDKNNNAINDNIPTDLNRDPGLANWKIFVNGAAHGDLTDAHGYVYIDVPPGTYTITEELQSGWTQKFPQSGSHIVTVGQHGVVEVDFLNYKPEDCKAISEGTLEEACCQYTFSVSNTTPDISKITYWITGGTMESITLSGSCNYQTTPVFGSIMGEISFPNFCNSPMQVQVEATPTTSTGLITITWVVYHKNGSSCTYTTEYTCERAPLTECDELEVLPFDFGPLGRDGRTFIIKNVKSPASPIQQVKISMSPPPPTVWNGANVKVKPGTVDLWTSAKSFEQAGDPKYSFIDLNCDPSAPTALLTNSMPVTDELRFNLGVDETEPWNGTVTVTTIHCDGDICVNTYEWCVSLDPLACIGTAVPSNPVSYPVLSSRFFVKRFMVGGVDGTRISYAILEPEQVGGDVDVFATGAAEVAIGQPGIKFEGMQAITSSEVFSDSSSRYAARFSFGEGLRAGDSVELPIVLALPPGTTRREVKVNLTLYDENANVVWTGFTYAGPISRIDEDDHSGMLGLGAQLNVPEPTPTSGIVRFSYRLPSTQDISLALFDLLGSRIATIESGTRESGEHSTTFNVERFPNGTYLLQLSTPYGTQTQPVIIKR